MKVLRFDAGRAVCRGFYGEETVNMLLVGYVQPGAYVLVNMGNAVRRLSREDALSLALEWQTVSDVSHGKSLDELFPDLTGKPAAHQYAAAHYLDKKAFDQQGAFPNKHHAHAHTPEELLEMNPFNKDPFAKK
jgi:hydrogenase maturation factor